MDASDLEIIQSSPGFNSVKLFNILNKITKNCYSVQQKNIIISLYSKVKKQQTINNYN